LCCSVIVKKYFNFIVKHVCMIYVRRPNRHKLLQGLLRDEMKTPSLSTSRAEQVVIGSIGQHKQMSKPWKKRTFCAKLIRLHTLYLIDILEWQQSLLIRFKICLKNTNKA
jgi:hypothetical protein